MGGVEQGGCGWKGAKLAAVPGCELKCIFLSFFSSFSISSLRASRGRLDYQSRAASGTFFSLSGTYRALDVRARRAGSLPDTAL